MLYKILWWTQLRDNQQDKLKAESRKDLELQEVADLPLPGTSIRLETTEFLKRV